MRQGPVAEAKRVSGGQSLSSLSNRAPPARPTGMRTQKSAAVPKISEAMDQAGNRAHYLTARQRSLARRCAPWSLQQLTGKPQHQRPWGIGAHLGVHHAAGLRLKSFLAQRLHQRL